MKLVSVIIPFHRDLNDLKKALISVNNQRLKKGFSIEICIGNDSKLKKEFLEEQLSIFSKYNINVFNNKIESGPGNARNAAINGSKGEILAFLDADDYWYKNKLFYQIQEIEKGYNFVVTNFKYRGRDIIILNPEKIINHKSFFFSRSIGTSTVMITRALLNTNRFMNIKFCQDILFWSSVSKSFKFKYKSIKKCLVSYSLNGRTSQSSYFERFFYFFKACSIAKLNMVEIFLAMSHYSTKGLINRFFKIIFDRIQKKFLFHSLQKLKNKLKFFK